MNLTICTSGKNGFTQKLAISFACVLFIASLVSCGSSSKSTDAEETTGDETIVQPLAIQTVADLQQPQPAAPEPDPAPQPEPEPEPIPEPQPPPTGPATVADITDLVLITGQSNTLGAGTSYDALLDAPNNRVMAFTENGWQVASLWQVWDRGWFPRNDPNTDPSNNFSLHFGKRVVERRPDRVVGFILLSAPGEKIRHWDEGGAFFEVIRDKVSRAINELPYKSSLDAILWHQGESDGEDRDEYGQSLYDLITRFRSEPWYRYEVPFICGETAVSPVNRQLRRLNSDNDPWTACIAAEGLETILDDTHFSAASLRTMGGRYADAYLEMMLGVR